MFKTKMYRHYRTLAAALGVLLLAGTTPARAGLFSMSEQEEIAAGKQAAAQAEKEFGGVMPSTHPYSIRVRALGQQLANLAERKSIPYTYHVLNSNEVLNAFAAPGGPVYVTRKLVETTANDAELAYVLGHETAHIERKHIVKAVEKQQKVGLAAGILGAILGSGRSGDFVNVAANLAFTVWSRGYGRDQESESDIVGVRMMSRLGYDPRAAVSMLGKLGSSNRSGLDKYLASQPAPADRQRRVTTLIEQENLVDVARRSGGPRLSGGFDSGYGAVPATYATPVPGAYPDTVPTNTAPEGYFPDYSENSRGAVVRPEGTELPLSSPLRLVNRQGRTVLTAPVAEIARWAGASVQRQGTVTRVVRGGNSGEFRLNSGAAYVNGRPAELVPPVYTWNGQMYVPVGYLATAVGATASLSDNNTILWLKLDNGRRVWLRVPGQ